VNSGSGAIGKAADPVSLFPTRVHQSCFGEGAKTSGRGARTPIQKIRVNSRLPVHRSLGGGGLAVQISFHFSVNGSVQEKCRMSRAIRHLKSQQSNKNWIVRYRF